MGSEASGSSVFNGTDATTAIVVYGVAIVTGFLEFSIDDEVSTATVATVRTAGEVGLITVTIALVTLFAWVNGTIATEVGLIATVTVAVVWEGRTMETWFTLFT